MKNNSVFWGMIGLSAVLHGLVMIGVSGSDFRTPSPVPENQFVSTIKMVKVGTKPQREAPSKPIEKKIVEKPIEAPPEPLPVQEIVHNEEVQEGDGTQAYDTGNNEGQEGGTVTDREYEALLAYIKEFINQNLVYPPMARRRNIQGIVSVYFDIEKNGQFVSVSVSRSSGSSILDNAAVSLIKKIPPLENLALNRTLALNVNIAYELTD
ncbi:MAG: TonB family protein [Treponema sp.]|jgi:protein TonB|nr:TonB family protein [Treponema sp.]